MSEHLALRGDPVAPTARAVTRVGVDVGGTKTHVATVTPAGRRHDVVVPSSSWRHGMLFDAPENFDRLVATIAAAVADVEPGAWTGVLDASVVLGLHGLDTPAQRMAARAELGARLGGPLDVVNDAELLGPASGHESCLRVIVGTGSVVMGVDANGGIVTADGYGALLSDYGSAPALVRETVRAALRHADQASEAFVWKDPVVGRLGGVYGAATLAELALRFSAETAYAWGRHGSLVFDAARDGSAVARSVIAEAADVLARNVAAVRRRGALGDVAVAAGGVIVNQPALQEELVRRLAVHVPEVELVILTVAPVEGALRLAARL